jgi:hypothetical protein
MLTVRLSDSEEKSLANYCQKEGLAKSQVVKDALVAYISRGQSNISPYQAGEDLFGQVESGATDKSTTYKKQLKNLLNEKHAH